MAEKDPNKLYTGIKSLQDDLESVKSLVSTIVENSKTLMNDANGFGGVIAKVFKEQMAKYFIPAVQTIAAPIDNIVSGDRVPGSLKDLTKFLDSVPLAMVRQEPSVSELASPVVPESVNLATPAETKVEAPTDDIPQNASYTNGTEAEAEEVKESKRPFKFSPFREAYMDEDWIEKWKASDKGKQEGDWFKNKVHGLKKGYNPFEDETLVNKPWNGLQNEWDAKDQLERFGRVYVDEENNSVLDPYYTDSLRKTWGEPDRLDDDANEAMTEAEDDGPCVYNVVRNTEIGSPLGEDISNVEGTVVCQYDNKEDADAKAEELNDTVLPEEKDLLGVSYKVEKQKLVKED